MKNILIVCNLDPQQLKQSIEFLQYFHERYTSEKKLSISTIEERDFFKFESSRNFQNYELLILHLKLDSEISDHRNISLHASKLSFRQLNPYNSLSEIFDNKFQFYNFMLANGFRQAETHLINKIAPDEFINKHDNFILKPCSGTESIDQKKIKTLDTKFYEYLSHIQTYDSAILQEEISFINEHKILFYKNHVMSANALNQNILDYCKKFYDVTQKHLEASRRTFD